MCAGAPKKCVRHLKQNARTVAGAGVSRDSTSVRKISQQLERLFYNVARANTMYVRDETDSARVMFVGRVV
jgi:predicted alpha/beta-hydrolase family hydrolase